MSERALTSAGFEGPDLNEGHSGHSEPLRTRPPRIPRELVQVGVRKPWEHPAQHHAVEARLRHFCGSGSRTGDNGVLLVHPLWLGHVMHCCIALVVERLYVV